MVQGDYPYTGNLKNREHKLPCQMKVYKLSDVVKRGGQHPDICVMILFYIFAFLFSPELSRAINLQTCFVQIKNLYSFVYNKSCNIYYKHVK